MQAASSCFVQPLFPNKPASSSATRRGSQIKVASVAFEPLSINYNSQFSVFPAEACEIVGGNACSANMYPEVRLSKSENKGTNIRVTNEQVDRDYFDYNSESKSVLMGEACDDLGGEFCEAPYAKGVY